MDFESAMRAADQGFFVSREPFRKVTSKGISNAPAEYVEFYRGELGDFEPSDQDESSTEWKVTE